MTQLMRSLRDQTIWSPSFFGVPSDRYANIYRLILPLLYVSMIWAGYAAIVSGVSAFADLSGGGNAISICWGGSTIVWGICCTVGVIFPKVFRLEAVGNSGIVANMSVYLLAVFILSSGGSKTHWFVVGISVGALLLAAWRMGDIRLEIRMRRREREKVD